MKYSLFLAIILGIILVRFPLNCSAETPNRIISTQSSVGCVHYSNNPQSISSNFFCSGHGSCVVDIVYSEYSNLTIVPNSLEIISTPYCLCDQGWGARNDFLNRQGEDCRSYDQTITILFSIACIWAATCVTVAIYKTIEGVRARIRQADNDMSRESMITSATRPTRMNNYTADRSILSNSSQHSPPRGCIGIFYHLYALSKIAKYKIVFLIMLERTMIVVMCFLHIFDGQRVCTDLAITMICFFECMLFWWMTLLVGFTFLRLNTELGNLQGQALAQSQNALLLFRHFLTFLAVFVLLKPAPLIIGYMHPEHQTATAITFFASHAFIVNCSGWSFVYHASTVVRILINPNSMQLLSESQRKPREKAEKRIRFAVRHIIPTLFIETAVPACICLWSWWRSNVTIQFSIMLITSGNAAIVCLFMFGSSNNNTQENNTQQNNKKVRPASPQAPNEHVVLVSNPSSRELS